jgi:hypothetical protein
MTRGRPSNKRPADVLHELQNLRRDLEARLQQNPDYRALVVIERALSGLSVGIGGSEASSPQTSDAPPSPSRKKISKADATAEILRERGKPLPLKELAGVLRQRGITFRSKRPELSLSANLSGHKRFRSIEFDGVRCWWFANRPAPANPDGSWVVCTENSIRVDDVTESPKLAE